MTSPHPASAPQRGKLTKRAVDRLEGRSGGDYFVWDAELRNFGVRVWPSGRRTYVLQFRDAGGRTRRVIIGEHGPMTPEEARARAMALRAEVVTARRDPTALDPAQTR